MALVDHEGVLKPRHVDFIGAQQVHGLDPAGRCPIEDTGDIESARLRHEAEIEPADPGRRRVEDVETVPAVSDHAGALGGRPRRGPRAVGAAKGALPQDQHGTLGVFEDLGEGVLARGDLGQCPGSGAELVHPVGELRRRAHRRDPKASRKITLAKTRVDQRRFPARIGPDE